MATPPREGPPFLLPVDSRFRGNDGGERSGVCPQPQSTTVPADSVSQLRAAQPHSTHVSTSLSCWLRSSVTPPQGPYPLLTGDHELQDVCLEDHKYGHRDGQTDGPLQNHAQEVAFLALKARGTRAYGEVLRADHLPQNSARGVGANGQVGAEPELLGRDLLQVGEQGVRGGVGARQRHPEPPADGREEREQDARGGSRQAEGKGHAGVIEQEPEPQDGDYGEDGPLELVEGLAVDPQRPSRAYPEHDEGDDVPYKYDRPSRREPVSREEGVVGSGLRHDRLRLGDVAVEPGPGHHRQPRRLADHRVREVYRRLRRAHGVFDRAYLHDQEQRDYDEER